MMADDKQSGTRTTGFNDYVDTDTVDAKKESPELDGSSDDEVDPSIWMPETWAELNHYLTKLAELSYKIYEFSSFTRNLHRDMKEWCKELRELASKSRSLGKMLKPHVDVLLETSTTTNKVTINTADKATGLT